MATLFFSFFSHTQTLNKNLFVYFWPIHTAGCISQYKITTITFRATLYDRAQFTVQFAVVKPVGYFWPLRQHRPAPPGYVPLMVGIFIVTLLRVPIIVHLGYPSELITLSPRIYLFLFAFNPDLSCYELLLLRSDKHLCITSKQQSPSADESVKSVFPFPQFIITTNTGSSLFSEFFLVFLFNHN